MPIPPILSISLHQPPLASFLRLLASWSLRGLHVLLHMASLGMDLRSSSKTTEVDYAPRFGGSRWISLNVNLRRHSDKIAYLLTDIWNEELSPLSCGKSVITLISRKYTMGVVLVESVWFRLLSGFWLRYYCVLWHRFSRAVSSNIRPNFAQVGVASIIFSPSASHQD